jgi:hypothetical protein
MTGKPTQAGRPTAGRLLADRAAVTVVAEHRDRSGRMKTLLVKAALAAHGRGPARDRTQHPLSRAACHTGPSRPAAT